MILFHDETWTKVSVTKESYNEHTGETVVDDGQVDFDNGGEGDDGEVV